MPEIQTSKNSSAVKLAECVKQAEEVLKRFREQRAKFLAEYCGPYYGANEAVAGKRIPLPLLFSLAQTLVPMISMREIRADVTSEMAPLRPFGRKMGAGIDKVCREVDAAAETRSAIFDMLWGVGIVKVGCGASAAASGGAESGDILRDPGQPFVAAIDLDNYFVDDFARKRSRASFEGDSYSVLYEWAMDSDFYDKAGRDEIERLANLGEPQPSGGKVKDLSSGSGAKGGDPFEKWIYLKDLWLPHQNAVVTIPGDLESVQRYIREVAWDGPERGPYEMLAPFKIPTNVMPVCLAGIIYDLYELCNILANKVARQAESQKDVGYFEGPSEADGQRIKDAEDGQMVRVDNSKGIGMLSWRGANKEGYVACDWFYEFFRKVSGNLDTLGGLETQAKTLGQEEMLLQQAGIRVNDIRNAVQEFGSRIVEKLAWWLWTDPQREMNLLVSLPGGIQIPARWTPEAREGDFLDYNFQINPYSLGSDSPEQQYRKMMELVKEAVIPLAPFGMPQGSYPNVGKLVADLARNRNIPEVDEWWLEGLPQVAPQQGGPQTTETTNISLARGGQQTRPQPAGQPKPQQAVETVP